MSGAGHNNPPGMIETARQTTKDLSDWMAENPVIQTEESAREAKLFLDRGYLGLKDLDDERKAKVAPLNLEVKTINDEYRGPRALLEGVHAKLQLRLGDFLRAEERRKQEVAAEAARQAAEAEQRAREAEAAERDAEESAQLGEVGIDMAAHAMEAGEAFVEFQKAARQADLAKRETKVKIAGGFTRAASLRKKETLIVVDPIAAINDMAREEIDEGMLIADIRDAIIKLAITYRKFEGRLPNGVISEITREL